MSVELKTFGGRFKPKKGALEKDSSLPIYGSFRQAKNKTIAKTLLHADFIQFAPDCADDYFAPEVWEVEEGMFCTVEGQFHTDLFTGDIIWNAEKGEPERVLIEPELADDGAQNSEDEVSIRRCRLDTAAGVIARNRDFDIEESAQSDAWSLIKKMSDEDSDPVFCAWWKMFRRNPLLLEKPKAARIAVVKTSPEGIHLNAESLRKYAISTLENLDYAQINLIADIACGRTSVPLPQKNNETSDNDQTEQTLPDKTEIPAVCPARAAELDRELEAAFANSAPAELDEELRHKTSLMLAQQRGECIPELGDDPTDQKWDSMAFSASNEGEKTEVTEQEDIRNPMDDREIEIAHVLNELLDGCANISDVLPKLLDDIVATEYCLHPNFSDDEILDVANIIIDPWSDSEHERRKIAMDAIVESRRPEPPAAVVIKPPVVTVKPKKEPEPMPATESTALTYRQQLTIAALQGVCANPAYRSCDEVGILVVEMVDEVIRTEAGL
jgi:exodeoxyribonuclease VIII